MPTLQPARVHATLDDAEKISFFGMDAYWLITREMSNGTFAQVLHISPPGTGVPMHVHHAEAESMHVIEGEVVGRLGAKTVTCHAGDALMLPPGVPHGWRVAGDSAARLLFTIGLAPGTDWETMFRAFAGLAPTDFEEIQALSAANGIELVEPPEMP
jgi:quercetin dioxygenase-like cupin family protein